jgi:SIT4-associating protein SAP185/190
MVLLNDPRGEQVVQERDLERERLRKEGHTTQATVDIWGDTALPNGRQWATNASSSDGSEEEQGDDVGEIKSAKSAEKPQSKQHSVVSNNESSSLSNQISVTKLDESELSKVDIETPLIPRTPIEERALSPTTTHDVEPKPEPSSFPEADVESSLEPGTAERAHPNGIHESNANVIDHNAIPSLQDSSQVRPVVGDYLKMQFVEATVLPSVVDLFFAHPWNNFLHNVVYDILTQVLNGPMDKGFNRQLAIDLFTTGQLTEKILLGQEASDEAQYVLKCLLRTHCRAKDKGVRLGYMGHLTLIAEEVLKLAERTPLELLDPAVVQKLTSREWNDYVDVTLTATRTRDNAILGGVRPQPTGLNVGLNSSSLAASTTGLSGVDDNAVLAAIVNRGLRYENGESPRVDDDFEDEPEVREPGDEPVSFLVWLADPVVR